jgi:hypothetical protein
MPLLRWLRTHPSAYWLMLVLYSTAIGVDYIVRFNPAWGQPWRWDSAAYLLIALALGVVLARVGGQAGDARRMGALLAQSRFTGALLALTTVILLLFGIEGYLRMTMVRSDAFAFTLMHKTWLEIYWHPINALGYRDNAPNADPNAQHILVLGDSFASGHGVNTIADTFPHMLAQRLGAGYSVNIAAQPGWDTNRLPPALAEYPVQPQIVVISYFFNDIGYAMPSNPVQVTFPQGLQKWLNDHFFISSFLYWNVYQARQSGPNYQDALSAVYADPTVWAQQTANLGQILGWSRDRGIRVIALVWSPLVNAEPARPAMQQVLDYFAAQGVATVDMYSALANYTPAEIIVNPFDAHPNATAQRVAAEQLQALIAGE